MKNERSCELQLDPCIARQLEEEAPKITEKTQWYLDNPDQITTFMDFRVDFAFKFILGHKPILKKLLNDILPVQVSDIEYLPNEIPVISEKEKRAAFDVICTEKDTGEKFLIEMQRRGDTDMDDRLIYYGASLIHNQVRRGDTVYLLQPVFVVCIADYLRKHAAIVPENKMLFHYSLRETELGEGFSDNRLHFYIMELPRLQKVWESLDENVERWCYLFENLHNFVHLPKDAKGFEDVFEIAQTGQMEQKGLLNYLNAMITEYEWNTYTEYARREGIEEGIEKGEIRGVKKLADKLLAMGVSPDVIKAAQDSLPKES